MWVQSFNPFILTQPNRTYAHAQHTQRHVLKPSRGLGKTLYHALQAADYSIVDCYGPGLTPLAEDYDTAARQALTAWGTALRPQEGSAGEAEKEQGQEDGMQQVEVVVEEQQRDHVEAVYMTPSHVSIAAPATPAAAGTGGVSWGWAPSAAELFAREAPEVEDEVEQEDGGQSPPRSMAAAAVTPAAVVATPMTTRRVTVVDGEREERGR